MKKIIIAFVVLLAVSAAAYFIVFRNVSEKTPEADKISVEINIENFAFNPAEITVKAGAKVIWTNKDSVSHNIVSDTGNLLNSPVFYSGQSFSFTFTDTGSISYHCGIHPSMKGKIIVE